MARRQGRAGVCRHTVGLGSRRDRETFELTGRPEALDIATQLLTGRALPCDTAVHLDGGWLCRTAADRVLARFRSHDIEHALSRLQAAAGRDIALRDVGAEHAAADLVGPHAGAALETFGTPLPAARLSVRAVPALLVRDDEHLVDVAGGPAGWAALRDAGRRHGVVCAGCDARAETLL